MSLDELPMFVKEGAILPLAKPVEYITKETVFDITCRVYGEADNRSVHLFEDNGYTFDYRQDQYNWITLSWKKNKGAASRNGNKKIMRYRISSWEQVH
jgi:alpha-D-xyloside xylohydrolase